MIDLDITMVVQFINFLITLVVLNILLVKPIREILKKRAEVMAKTVDETVRFTTSAAEKLKNYEAALAEARAAGTVARLRLKDEGLAEEKKVVETASKDAHEFLVGARGEIAAQSKGALDSLTAKVDGMAQKAVAKILG